LRAVALSAVQLDPPLVDLKKSARSPPKLEATAYRMLRFEGAEATVMRPTPPVFTTPAARAHVAPSFRLVKICPSVVTLAARGSASTLTAKLELPVQVMDQP
jgi:hypothetical protein